MLAAILAGCYSHDAPKPRPDLTFERGAQMLAAGSPKSAIPFFSELIVTEPDGPEPHAMLALAYALDLEPELAIEQARTVRRNYRQGDLPGWEVVAQGIAAMTQRRGQDALTYLRQAADAHPDLNSAEGSAANQWLTLALIWAGENQAALDNLALAAAPQVNRPASRQTALIWSVLVHSQMGDAHRLLARNTLIDLARLTGSGRHPRDLDELGASTAGPQELGDAAVAALARGDLAHAERLLTTLNQREPNACDAAAWLGLVAAAAGQPDRCRQLLKAGCAQGPRESQALANQLFSVLWAQDGRAELLIQHLLAGQRLQCHNRFPMQVPREPARDLVWQSDRMK